MQKMKTSKALDTVRERERERERESSNLINRINKEKITRLDL